MKKILIIVIGLALIAFNLYAQSTFEKWIGGSHDGDIGYKIIPAVDGGYVIAASWSSDYGQTWDTEVDGALIKIDENGNIVWRTMIPTAARNTSDDRLVAVTRTQENDGYIAIGVIQTALAVGKEDLVIAKFNVNGDTIWTRTYDIASYDHGNSIIPAGDGGYIIAGTFGPLGNDNILFLKINASGDTLWTRTWGWEYEDRLNDVTATIDGSFYAVGCTKQTSSPYTLWDYIIKFNTNGDTIWTKRLVSGEAMSIRLTADGGYIIAEKQALVKVDANGDEQWRKSMYSFLASGGEVRCAVPVTGGGYVVTGKSTSTSPYDQQLFIGKFTSTGDTVWVKTFGKFESNKIDEGNWVLETSDGGYLSTGLTALNATAAATDIYLVKVNAGGVTSVGSISVQPKTFELDQNYPNPFNPSTTITYRLSHAGYAALKVFDMLGREVATLVNGMHSAGTYTTTWNAAEMPSGVYFYKFKTAAQTQTRSMLLLK